MRSMKESKTEEKYKIKKVKQKSGQNKLILWYIKTSHKDKSGD